MGESPEIEQFQRWLQARLAISENIEDPSERDRVNIQIESAIQLAIQLILLIKWLLNLYLNEIKFAIFLFLT